MSGDPHDEKSSDDQLITSPVNNPLCNAPLHICKSPLHTPHLETLSLNSLVQVIISSSYREDLGEREERVCKSLLHIAASDYGREVIKYLCQKGCVSNLEISRALSISRQAVMWHLDTLENLGLVRVYATVENEVRIPAQYRSAKVRGWVGLPDEYSRQAIQRYLTFFKKERKTPVPSQIEAVEEWAVRVEELLPMDLEGKLAPVYEAIRKAGVPSPLVTEVKDRVIGMRVRKVPGPGVAGVEEASP